MNHTVHCDISELTLCACEAFWNNVAILHFEYFPWSHMKQAVEKSYN